MIIVLDDHPIAREGLEAIIKMYKPQEDIVQAGTVEEAITLLWRPRNPILCLWIST